MRITLSNQSIDFFDDAFYNPYSDEFDVDLISSSSSRVVIENSDSGHRTTFLGTGLVAFLFGYRPLRRAVITQRLLQLMRLLLKLE